MCRCFMLHWKRNWQEHSAGDYKGAGSGDRKISNGDQGKDNRNIMEIITTLIEVKITVGYSEGINNEIKGFLTEKTQRSWYKRENDRA